VTGKPFGGSVKIRIKETREEFDFQLDQGAFTVDLDEAGTYQLVVMMPSGGGKDQTIKVTVNPGEMKQVLVRTRQKPVAIRIEKSKLVLPPIFFETGKTRILEQSYMVLDSVALFMQDRPDMRIRIEGHTDSIFEEEYNMILSRGRAKAVRAYLIEHGVDARRLEAKGFGESRPIATNETEEGRSKNRRVEFIVLQGAIGGGK